MPRDLGAGKARQRCGTGKVAVREQQGRRLKHENRDGETERHDMHSATNLFRDTQSLSQRVRDIFTPRRENVRATAECVYRMSTW